MERSSLHLLLVTHTRVRIIMENFVLHSSLMFISRCTLAGGLGLISSYMSVNSSYAQIEVTTGGNISSPIFNRTGSADADTTPEILYSALHSDTIVGAVLNNFTYPIQLVHITTSV